MSSVEGYVDLIENTSGSLEGVTVVVDEAVEGIGLSGIGTFPPDSIADGAWVGTWWS